ncbi:MAG: hypothetical protein LBM08_13450 [Dysgonamonadaceae bacterium]|jgi:hypothetical protein|nr:hypothetical protein [Dysgonamonadaceae bacterium]
METVTAKQIHESFDAAADNLVNAANVFFVNYDDALKVIRDKEDEATDSIYTRIKEDVPAIPFAEKAKRLKSLGFTGAREAAEFTRLEKREKNRVSKLWKLYHKTERVYTRQIDALKSQKEDFDLVLYYRKQYPFLKFITDEQLNGICKKYRLVYSGVNNYTGEVPDKNLKEIEDTEIKDRDLRPTIYHYKMNDIDHGSVSFDCDIEMYKSDVKEYAKKLGHSWVQWDSISVLIKRDYESLYIAAPKSHFKNLKLREKMGFGFFTAVKIQVQPAPKDPIVFKFVKGGVLIISKWGEEANDPALTVPELN